MLEKAREKFISDIRSEFIQLTNIKEIKERIEKRGYKTSRVYGHKNVKRLTASLADRTRLEFILSDKNLYIMFLLNFSNKLTDTVKLIARNEIKENISLITRDYRFNIMSSPAYCIYYNNRYPENYQNNLDSMHLYFSKYRQAEDARFVREMMGINEMANKRDIIIFTEINQEKLPLLSEIKVKQADTLVKNIANDTVDLLLYQLSFRDFSKDKKIKILSFEDKDFFNGFIFYKYVFNKFKFTKKDLIDFFDNYVEDYILSNRDMFFQKYSKSHNEYYAKNIHLITKSFFNKAKGLEVDIDIESELSLLSEECNLIQESEDIDLSSFDFSSIDDEDDFIESIF